MIVNEISVLDGIAPGTAQASKALVLNSSSNISGIASLVATGLTGTLQTAAQPNITSVGTLTSLTFSGGISGATNISASGTINLSRVVNCNNSTYASSPLSGSLAVSGGVGIQRNIAIGGIAYSTSQWAVLGVQYQARSTTYTDTSSAAGATIASSVISSGTNTKISNSYSLWVASGNVLVGDSSASSSTTTGALVVSGGVGVGGQLTASTTAGTLQTAAKPNITSVGTLASLTVSGGLTVSTLIGTLQTTGQSNITSFGTLSQPYRVWCAVSQYYSRDAINPSTANITSVGMLTSLDVSGALTASTVAGTIQTAAQPISPL
ncbi:unnamed protein product [Phytophthora fragariaefolia]|uniref:Unnamed protein product n=1 Tax=Phytophthora fragariaefolia TaxID=1490495 RepID=A0A9W6XY53_9STRA|nr:unnamed protein product [Phytophthora fragariaefolia]